MPSRDVDKGVVSWCVHPGGVCVWHTYPVEKNTDPDRHALERMRENKGEDEGGGVGVKRFFKISPDVASPFRKATRAIDSLRNSIPRTKGANVPRMRADYETLSGYRARSLFYYNDYFYYWKENKLGRPPKWQTLSSFAEISKSSAFKKPGRADRFILDREEHIGGTKHNQR